jgi:HK97 gp10 family phage protein
MPPITSGSFTIIVTGEEKVILDLGKRTAPRSTLTLNKAVRAAAAVMRPFIMANAPVATGATRRSVSVRTMRKRAGEAAAVSVGPRTWYRHFPIGGTSRGITANPWVERGRNAGGDVAARRVLTGTVLADFKKP